MDAKIGRHLAGGASKGAVAAVGTTLLGTAFAALANAPERFGALFHRRFPIVAVTGMTGVGKTALANRLSRTSPGDPVEVGSAVMERRTRRKTRMRGFRFRVVPGENAATRLGALDDVFNEEPVDGIIHVVAYGHATPRRTGGTSGTAVASREQQLAAELEDFAITAHRIASMAIRRKEPTWLIIAVTKTDLYPGELEAAVDYYSPGSGSPFAAKLDDLRALAGAAKLSIDVLPVSSEAADKKASKAGTALLGKLEARLEQLSGHV